MILSTLGLTVERARGLIRGTLVHEALCVGLRSARQATIPEEAPARLIARIAALADLFAGFAPAGGLGLAELEVNPFVASEDGRLVALDALARLGRPGRCRRRARSAGSASSSCRAVRPSSASPRRR